MVRSRPIKPSFEASEGADFTQIRKRAIALLARREYSRAQLREKLSCTGPSDAIDAVLDSLAASGLQSDVRFAQAWINAHMRRWGVIRLRHTLRLCGIDETVIEHALCAARAEGQDHDDITHARDVLTRKFQQAPDNPKAWAQQARFLQGRGFDADTVRKALRDAPVGENCP
jgi:regulatory protein